MNRPFVIFVIVAVVLIWAVFGVMPGLWFGIGSEKAALVGDSFGFATSLFSGLALVGVVIAIVMQSQELRLQREELKQTRSELKLSAYFQTLTAAVSVAEEEEKVSALPRARSRVRRLRLNYELDHILNVVAPDVQQHSLAGPPPQYELLEYVESLVALADALNLLAECEVGVSETLSESDLDNLLNWVQAQCNAIDDQFRSVLKRHSHLSDARQLQEQYDKFIEWVTQTMTPYFENRSQKYLGISWTDVSLVRFEIIKIALAMTFEVPVFGQASKLG